MEGHQRARVAYARGTQDEAADHGKDGRVGGDAESYGNDSCDGEGRRFAQPANSMGQVSILPQIL